MVTLVKNIPEMQRICRKETGIGFVATMGNLHEGHLELLKKCRQENKVSILSIFVNPKQFNNSHDFQTYPHSLPQDLELAKKAGVDYIFLPNENEMYADNYQYKIIEDHRAQKMEGKFRPGHFTGMLTVVMKLLQIIRPTRTYFGEKDYQQYQLVQGMIKAFFLDTEIILCPTVREPSGLAFSSRNNLLTPEEKQKAAYFYKTLSQKTSCQIIKEKLEAQGFKIEYIEEQEGRRFGAIYVGKVRLIDNVPL